MQSLDYKKIEENKKILGSILRKKRIEKDLSMDIICQRISISRQALINIEQGRTDFKIETFFAICAAMFLQPDLIIKEMYESNYRIYAPWEADKSKRYDFREPGWDKDGFE